MLGLTYKQIDKELIIRLSKYGFVARFRSNIQNRNVSKNRICTILGVNGKIFSYNYNLKTKKVTQKPLIRFAKYNDPKRAVLIDKRPRCLEKTLDISKIGNTIDEIFAYIVFLILQIVKGKPISYKNYYKPDNAEEIQKQIKSGAGFANKKENKKIESAAINYVCERYIFEGWEVKSVESDKIGYDLKCKKKDRIEKVEVKGIKGNDKSFIITLKELELSKKDKQFVLCLVNNALSKNKILSKYSYREFSKMFIHKPIIFKSTIKI